MRSSLLAALLFAVFAFAACGGEGNGDEADGDGAAGDPTEGAGEANGNDDANGENGPTPPARQVDDEEYLALICSGLSDFSDAVISATSADELTSVIQDFVASLDEITPPDEVRDFHADFMTYLRDGIEEPTELLTAPRPLPDDDVRQRLSDLESSVSECEGTSFFAEREDSAGE